MEGYCRACLREFNEPTDLLQYSESKRRLFVYCTGIQVKRNDTFIFQLCKECFFSLKFACKFKKLCRTSDKKFKNYLSLKNEDRNLEMGAYLKNIDDSLSLQLPILNKTTSTPLYQRNYDDDDNESTCTSIQNFMTDIRETLQGEDILPTEANIIQEVIQEEADLSDDSLDSQWLQDDVSMDNAFELDLSLAGFSTPHSTNNDRCSVLEKISNDEDDTCHYIHKDIILKSDKTIVTHNKKDTPSMKIGDRHVSPIENEYDVDNIIESENQQIEALNQNDMPILDECDAAFDGIINRSVKNSTPESNYHIKSSDVTKNESVNVILTEEIKNRQVIKSPFTTELEFYMTNVKSKSKISNDVKSILHGNEDSIDRIIKTAKVDVDKNIENIELQAACELDKFINNAELKKKLSKTSIKYSNVEECSIDRNLEMALKNDDSEYFALDQLLISPQVSLRSAASTPTINSILFGNLTPITTESIRPHSPKPKLPNSFTKALPKNEKDKVKKAKQTKRNDIKKVRKPKEKSLRIFKGNIKSNVNLRRSDRKTKSTGNKGYKDINKLKELTVLQNETGQSSDESIDASKDSDSRSSLEQTDEELSDSLYVEQGHNDDETYVKSQNTEPDDLDISITNLLDYDGNNSIDFNISIASDFLIDGNDEQRYTDSDKKIDNDLAKVQDIKDDNELKSSEKLFKVPLPPPDNKYDLELALCKICNKTFKNSGALKQHFVKLHKQLLPRTKKKINPKMCPKCGKFFRDLANFNRHMKSHEQPENIKCEYCKLEFPTLGRYNMHLKSHAKEIERDSKGDKRNGTKNKNNGKDLPSKSYQCATCGKTFTIVSNYYVHIKRHTTDYTQKCEICGKGFFRMYDLKQHMVMHNKEKPFQCQYCPKQYRNRYTLVGHMYTHLDKSKFKCDACDQNFITNQGLIRHYKTEKCASNRKAKAVKASSINQSSYITENKI